MTGTWYEVERSFYVMEMAASCTELHLLLSERGHLLITVNTINRWYVKYYYLLPRVRTGTYLDNFQ